jgi:hypothetical protein
MVHQRAAAPGHRGGDPVDAFRQRLGRDHLAEAGRHRVHVGLAGPPHIDVGDHVRAGRDVRGQLADGAHGVGQLPEVDGGGDHPGRLHVLGGDERAARDVARADVRQALVAVVAAGQHLQQRRRVGTGPADALAE